MKKEFDSQGYTVRMTLEVSDEPGLEDSDCKVTTAVFKPDDVPVEDIRSLPERVQDDILITTLEIVREHFGLNDSWGFDFVDFASGGNSEYAIFHKLSSEELSEKNRKKYEFINRLPFRQEGETK